MKNISPPGRLTTRQFWVDYWAKTKAGVVTDQVFFKDLLKFFPKSPASLLEIGGFPGALVTYFKKFHDYDVTLLDYIIVKDVIAEVEKMNGLKSGDIQTLEADFFEVKPDRQYDVVFSAGFVEHFTDTEDVFKRHVNFLKPSGTLFISVPNFKGISGLVQKTLDPHNYNVHHIGCMEKSVYQNLCAKYNLKIQHLDYYGVPHTWLDHPENVNFSIHRLVNLTNLIFIGVSKLNGRLLKGRFFSPFIVLIAQKNN